MAKPGVMFYFDVRPCIKRLDAAEKGRLFEAILDYGEFGVVPELDGALGVAWDFIQPKLDRDSGRYDRQVEQRQYAVYVREAKKREETPMPFDAWKHEFSNEGNREVSADIGRYPTTTIKPQPTTINSQSTTKDRADKPHTRHKYGSYKNVLFTDEEYDKLQAEFPGDYSERIERLSEYIASTGKSYKSHLATIRSWARKDGTKAGSMPSYGGEENWSL